jgi:hypothetical protein
MWPTIYGLSSLRVKTMSNIVLFTVLENGIETNQFDCIHKATLYKKRLCDKNNSATDTVKILFTNETGTHKLDSLKYIVVGNYNNAKVFENRNEAINYKNDLDLLYFELYPESIPELRYVNMGQVEQNGLIDWE